MSLKCLLVQELCNILKDTETHASHFTVCVLSKLDPNQGKGRFVVRWGDPLKISASAWSSIEPQGTERETSLQPGPYSYSTVCGSDSTHRSTQGYRDWLLD